MALKLMAGWDLYPGAYNPTTNLATLGAGITGTHYAPLFSIERNGFLANILGVSGRPEHKFGRGTPLERNGLSIQRTTSMNSAANIRTTAAYMVPPVNGIVAAACSFKFDPSSALAGQTLPILCFVTGTNAVINANMVSVFGGASGFQLVFLGTQIPITTMPYLQPDREYHIELQIYRAANAANADTYSYRLYVDGDLIVDRPNATSLPAISTSGVRPCWGHLLLNANVTWVTLYADLIVADSTEGDFAEKIGPHLILPGAVGAVTPGLWEKEGNATAAASLSDLDDTTYFASPETAGALTAKISAPNVPYKARASEVVVRASRDRDAGRILTAEVLGSDGSALIPLTNIATGNGYADYLLQRISGKSDADTRSPTVRLNASVP